MPVRGGCRDWDDAVVRVFYRILLFWSRFDVAIGVATGRAQKYVDADRADVSKWQHALLMLELNN